MPAHPRCESRPLGVEFRLSDVRALLDQTLNLKGDRYMNAYIRGILWIGLVALFAALAPAMTRAEVMRVEISSRQDVLGGKAFGTVGAYEKLSGKVYFAVDPKLPANRGIVDIDLAPRNAASRSTSRPTRTPRWASSGSPN